MAEIPASQIDFREFGQALCYELNQIIHDEQNESPSLKKKIIDKLEDNSQTRKEIKRQIIEKKLTTEIIRKLDDFEHIEPPQITYLRSYSNFMSPRTGLFSIDTWTLIVIYFRNLFLNWTVFLPLIAVFLLLPKLFPAVLNSSLKNYSPHNISFWIFVIAGVFAVTGIIAMRPSLSDSSWIKQEYKIDENGMLINAQSKVVRWALLPMITVSFVITSFWVWAQSANNTQFIIGEQFINWFSTAFPETGRLFRFIIIYEILFLGGFVIAHSVLKFLKLIDTNAENKDLFRNWKQLIWEFVASFLSGAVGGVTLYIFSNLLLRLNQYGNSIKFEDNYIYACFGPPLFLFSVLISTAFFFGIAGKIYSDMDREWLSRFGAMNLMFIVGWSILSGLIFLSPSIIAKDNFSILKFNRLFDIIPIPPSLAIGIIAGLITLVLGFSGKTPATEEKEAKSLKSSILKIAPQIAAPIFALFLIILIS